MADVKISLNSISRLCFTKGSIFFHIRSSFSIFHSGIYSLNVLGKFFLMSSYQIK